MVSIQTAPATKVLVKSRNRSKDSWVPYVYILPFLISFLVFFAFPSVYSFVLSFYNYKGYGNATFVGLNNYISLMQYPMFWSSVYNTFFYFVVHTPPVMIISFLLAFSIHSKAVSPVFKNIYKPLIFLTQIMSIVAASLVFKVIFSTRSGVINQWLGTQYAFLDDPDFMKWSVVVLITWTAIGWYMVVFLVGLTTINDEINEAATLDGASTMQRMFRITLPLMKPIFLFAFLINAVGSMKIYTQPILLITNGNGNAPSEAIPILKVLTDQLLTGNFGRASAVGWVLFGITACVSFMMYRAFEGKDKG